jgi:hypothetical protein
MELLVTLDGAGSDAQKAWYGALVGVPCGERRWSRGAAVMWVEDGRRLAGWRLWGVGHDQAGADDLGARRLVPEGARGVVRRWRRVTAPGDRAGLILRPPSRDGRRPGAGTAAMVRWGAARPRERSWPAPLGPHLCRPPRPRKV